MLYDIIIIGGGPAGITAGIYAARKRMKTLLLSKDFLGQVSKTERVDNWPGDFAISGMDLIKKFKEHLQKFKEVEVKDGEEVVKVSRKGMAYQIKTKSGKTFQSKTVIASTGRAPRKLKVKGEKEFENRGVSYCSVCDGPFFQDKKVVVVGGGNSGFETALDLARHAKRISILEKGEKVRADEMLQGQVSKDKKIQVFLNKETQEIQGKDKVETIIFKDLKNKKVFHQPVDGVFVSVGYQPSADYLKGLAKINKQGEVKVDPIDCQTFSPGLFAAGDINDLPFNQIVTAAGQGCSAALAAYKYLQSHET